MNVITPVTLGRLERVPLHDVWTHEAHHFTPWLAAEENLKLLGDTIGIDLELEAQEQSVGPFRADILCKDLATGNLVLIENQLERTDHSHLGQLLTYAAGLNAVNIVWLASRFTDEHRAALDWLNTITSESINFFGLEIELWRIGTSAIAPKFNIISQPNDWSKIVSDSAKSLETQTVTELGQLQREYWTAFRAYLLEQSSSVKPQKPLPQHWMNFAIGRSNFLLAALINSQGKWIGVCLDIFPPNAKPHYYLLQQQKDVIEHELGTALEWQLLPDRKQSRALLRCPGMDPTARDQWPQQHPWLKDHLERFRAVFGPRVKALKAEDYATSGSEIETPDEIGDLPTEGMMTE